MLAETDLDAVLADARGRAARGVRDRLGADAALRRARASAPGTVGQVREVATGSRGRQAPGTAVLLVGHVTKEGALAGPRVLEHLVDCVLQFEGERERTYRTLRALKNRFGSTNEVGVFEMREGGLVEVLDASARFVGEATKAPGLVVLAAMEGSRPLLVEVQALVSPVRALPPRRVCNGIDRNRLALVLAVLGRHAGVGVGHEPTSSSTSSAACASTSPGPIWRSRSPSPAPRGACRPPTPSPLACFGEVGLTGELRTVAHPDRRMPEAAKFGLRRSCRPARARADAARGASRRRSCERTSARPRAPLDTASTSLSSD